MTAPVDPLADVSARIKDVYIELNDYAYFHGPSDVGREDRRFLGRREVLRRLRSLLNDYECPSGAYLVTGFRGAGKSSLVAKALARVMPPLIPSIGIRRVLRIVAPVAASALFELPAWLFYALLAVVTLALALLIYTDPRRPNRRRLAGGHFDTRRGAGYLASAGRATLLEPEAPPCTRERAFLQDGLAISLLLAVFMLLSPVTQAPNIPALWWRLIAACGYCLLPPLILPVWRSAPRGRPPAAAQQWRAELYTRIREIRFFVRKIVVKINLSQENLREIDVLRMMAGSLESQYRAFCRPTLNRLFFRLLLLLPFLLLSYWFYSKTLRGWAHDIKTDFHISCYLPSQGSFLLECSQQAASASTRDKSSSLATEPLTESACYQTILREHLDTKARAAHLGAPPFRNELERNVSPRWKLSLRTTEGGSDHYFTHRPRHWTLGGRIQHSLLTASSYLDTLIQVLLDRVTHYLFAPIDSFWPNTPARSWPRHIDYFAVLFVLLGWCMPPIILRWLFGRLNHRDVLAEIVELNSRIASEVTHEGGAIPLQPNSWLTISFGRRRSQTFQILSEREIEKHLLAILDHTQRISPLEVRPEFIFIFDELDKIQQPTTEAAPRQVPSDSERDQQPGVRADRDGEFSTVGVERDRQYFVLGLVSNLKHFLSTAPAKFIFIAGREMFDAALADVSDRQFFMGSVFNEVIHVPSLHSDPSDGRLPDITSWPEEYVCRFLLPRHWLHERPSLKLYREYLDRVLLPPDGGLPEPVRTLRRDKALHELHNFITYLTYRSNGAPKKLTAIFERFVVPLSDRDHDSLDRLVLGRSNGSLYLRFGYYDQYAFGLVTFLASPLIFSVNRAIKDYGDKILVSSSFVLDHIFKFHGHGFAWRNLELLPEVVDVGRAPQLRELLRHIMRFLSRGQINEIISGLYDFKFTRRISEEIAFLSKISEHESAAFNFTLDESLALKRHFYSRLARLRMQHGSRDSAAAGRAPLVNSISFLHMILGDLHFYDGEYDSAIIEYMEAVQPLRTDVSGTPSADMLLLMIRNFLKLGLAFERKKSFDSALVSYARVSALVLEVARTLSSSGANATDSQRYASLRNALEGVSLLYQPLLARLHLLEKTTLGGINSSHVEEAMRDFTGIAGRGRPFGGRYLVVAEYHNKIGDLLFFKNGPTPTTKSTQRAYCERPEALCSKNICRGGLLKAGRRLPCLACENYHQALEHLCSEYLEVNVSSRRESILLSIVTCFDRGHATRRLGDRSRSVRGLADTLSDIGDTFISCAGVQSTPPGSVGITDAFVSALADLLRRDAGGTEGLSKAMGTLLETLRELEPGDGSEKLGEALCNLAVSAILFHYCSNERAWAIQLIKILWLLREYASVKSIATIWPEEALSSVARAAIDALYRCHEGTHRLEIEKLKEIFATDFGVAATQGNLVRLSRLSINANVTEILVVLRELGLRREGVSREPVCLEDLASPYAMFHSVYSRIHALRLRGRIHYVNLNLAGLPAALNAFPHRAANGGASAYWAAAHMNCGILRLGRISHKILPWYLGREMTCSRAGDFERGLFLLAAMIVDGIYCCHEIVRLLRIYGRSYMASHTMKAAAHNTFASWCDFLFSFLKYTSSAVGQGFCETVAEAPTPEALREQLERAIGSADMVHLSPNYQREAALRHLKAAVETHTEGPAYRELLEDMHYLNDDFADHLEHFCAALERLRINSGNVDETVRVLQERLRSTSIYDPARYLS